MADLYFVELLKSNLPEWSKIQVGRRVVRPDVIGPAFLGRIDLTGANLEGLDLSGVDLSGVDLTGANLSRTNLSGATIIRSTLDGSNLRHANLTGVDFNRVTLRDVDVTGAGLSTANPAQVDFSGADYDDSTRWPEWFNPPRRDNANGAHEMPRLEKVASLAAEHDRLRLARCAIEPLIAEIARVVDSDLLLPEDETSLHADRGVLNEILRHPNPPVQIIEATVTDVARILASYSTIARDTQADLVAEGIPPNTARRIGQDLEALFAAAGTLDVDKLDGGLTEWLEQAAEIGNELQAAGQDLTSEVDDPAKRKRGPLRSAAFKGLESGVEKGVEQLVSSLIGSFPSTLGIGISALVGYFLVGNQTVGAASGGVLGALVAIIIAITKRTD